ncbi:MAG: helix-turn-helix transcriptional regulator [Gammaproteobacteria bacterium]|nr:helix-turn-helix transcriptional regulator [Gammaproteobacteria bacterium]
MSGDACAPGKSASRARVRGDRRPEDPCVTPRKKTTAKTRRKEAPPEHDRALDQYIGTAIHNLRLRHHLTSAEVARRAGVSRGMMSKIENGQTATSIETLRRIAKALGETLSNLFLELDTPRGGAQLVKSGQGMEIVRRGTKKGHIYKLLHYDRGPRKFFDPFEVTLSDESEVFPAFKHPGTEMLYILEGRMKYRHGQETYLLTPGDTLTFNAQVPHGPEQFIKLPIRLLVFIVYPPENATLE